MGRIVKFLDKKKAKDPMFFLNLEDQSLTYEGIKNGVRVWYTPDGDGIGLHYLGFPPDLPDKQPTIEAFCTRYRSMVQAAVVEVGIHKLAGVSAVRTLGKIPQNPTGNTFVGAYTIPLRDASYIVKIQCQEHGTTGIREAVLLDRGLASGEVRLDDSGNLVGNWAPYDHVHDKDFPGHPLSRCRKGLSIIASTLSVADEIKRLPGFYLPNNS